MTFIGPPSAGTRPRDACDYHKQINMIMVVFDIAVEKDYLPTGGLLISAADWRDWTWGSIERSFKQWSTATGVGHDPGAHRSLAAASPQRQGLLPL